MINLEGNNSNINSIAKYDNSDMGSKIASSSNASQDLQKLKHEKDINSIKSTYEEVLYLNQNNIYPSTSHNHLAAIASLFGIKMKKTNFRILEVGCGFGENLIPYAHTHPSSEFIGVDLSSKAIEAAKKRAEELNLTNIKFHDKSFTELDVKEIGKFDMIVAHGVYSWITDELKEDLFKFVSVALDEKGLFYVSYNVAPGWYMAQATSDYLKTACGNLQEPERQNQVLQHLRFLERSLANNNTPYSLAMKQEIKSLLNQSYGYIRHDHMSDNNKPVSFQQITNTAAKYGMQYMSEVNLGSLIVPDEFKELKEVKDIITQQSYLDFLTGRKFRSSIFVRNTTVLNKNIDQHSIQDINFASNLTVTNPIASNYDNYLDLSQYNVQVLSNENMSFSLDKNPIISSNEPIMKACLLELVKLKYKSNNFAEIVKNIKKDFNFDEGKINAFLSELIIKCLLQGIISMHYDLTWDYTKIDIKKPKLSKIVKNQIDRRYPIITGETYYSVKLDDFLFLILQNFNGTNTVEDIKNITLDAFKADKLSVTISYENPSATSAGAAGATSEVAANNKEISQTKMSIEDISANIDTWVKNYINAALINGLLV